MILNVILTDKDIFDRLLKNDSDEDFNEYVNEHEIFDFEGTEFDGDYSTTISSLYENTENPAVPLIRYLLTLTLCSQEETQGLIELATGKYIDEIEVPMSEVETDWLADQEEDAEEPEEEK